MARRARISMVVWAAGGNVVPAAGLAKTLARRGHEVRVLGPAVLRDRFERVGCAFFPYVQARPPHLAEVDDFDNNLLGWSRFICGHNLAEDVVSRLEEDRPDVVVVDAFLSAGLAAAERVKVPAVALVHVLYGPSVEGPLAAQWDPTRPMVDQTRHRLGLAGTDPTVPLIAGLWAKAALVLVCVPAALDYPVSELPDNVRYVGPVLDDPASLTRPDHDPLLLVSFSTTYMRQEQVLQRVLDALSAVEADVICTLGNVPIRGLRPPANAKVRGWVPHSEILPYTSVVVTHAGLSTVTSSLASGVPLTCLPMGRDQPLNAARVADLGLGLQVPMDAPADSIRSAVEEVLGKPSFSEEARRMSARIAGYGNGAAAAEAVEALL